MNDAFAINKMAKQKFRPTRLGVFSGAKAYIVYVEVLKKCRNAVGRTFCDAIMNVSAATADGVPFLAMATCFGLEMTPTCRFCDEASQIIRGEVSLRA
jgi:hypothetical protein